MKNLKSNKGITLLGLTIYMIAVLITIGIMAIIRDYFFANLNVVKETAKYAAEFDNFNTFFVKDVKDYTDLNINDDGKTYIFNGMPDGSSITYRYITYPPNNIGDIYRDSVKIATNVTTFQCEKKTIYVNNTEKYLIRVTIEIGVPSNHSKKIFSKTMQYTMNYWDRLN